MNLFIFVLVFGGLALTFKKITFKVFFSASEREREREKYDGVISYVIM